MPASVAKGFQLKGSFLPCMVVQIENADLAAIECQLQKSIGQAPNLFAQAPIVIDLAQLDAAARIDFIALKKIMVGQGLLPIGVRGGSPLQQDAASLEGFPIFNFKRKPTEVEKTPARPLQKTTLVTGPVRSGAQIVAEGDLIVTASVSPGAELFAGGHIHVYGTLRGRAFAGVRGNEEARIFCRNCDAELVSIAGYYLTNEDIEESTNTDRMTQIYLDDAQVCITSI